MKTVLTIAGSDSGGGAGIQADIKTITVHKMYAMSAVTALTAQNTMGVYGIHEVPAEFVGKQLDCIFTDIHPDAVKIGMVPNDEIIRIVAQKLTQYQAENIVIDPVMVSTSGKTLVSEEAADALSKTLLPLAAVITPNFSEAEVLCGFAVKDESDMIRAAEALAGRYRGAVLIKGGHLAGDAKDLLYDNGRIDWYQTRRISNPNSHGTGCTLSSAIACNLADGKSTHKSIRDAKAYLTGALEAMLDLGKGTGPMDHTYRL